jgi:hypothetical protein
MGCPTTPDNPVGLQTSPTTGLRSEGPVGGSFSPEFLVYSVTNTYGVTVNYTVSCSAPWLSLSTSGGSLEGGASVNVTATVNAQALSLACGSYVGTIVFTNTTTHVGDTVRPVRLDVIPYSWTLDADAGWATEGEWAFGQPTGGGGQWHGYADPMDGATGSYVYGVNLNGDYGSDFDDPFYLTAGPIDMCGMIRPVLRFQRWLNTDIQPYVSATVEASGDGAAWTPLWCNPDAEIADGRWTTQEIELPRFLDNVPALYVRWGYQVHAGAWSYSGWNIDDVQVLATDAPARHCDSNCDGEANGYDIDPFTAALAGGETAWVDFHVQHYGSPPACSYLCANDVNGDGAVNGYDIDPFVECLTAR